MMRRLAPALIAILVASCRPDLPTGVAPKEAAFSHTLGGPSGVLSVAVVAGTYPCHDCDPTAPLPHELSNGRVVYIHDARVVLYRNGRFSYKFSAYDHWDPDRRAGTRSRSYHWRNGFWRLEPEGTRGGVLFVDGEAVGFYHYSPEDGRRLEFRTAPISRFRLPALAGVGEDNAHFFFLPPLSQEPVSFSGSFDPDRHPIVEVCEWGGTACLSPLVARLDNVEVNREEEHYQVVWHPAENAVDAGPIYRITVLLGGDTLGHHDLGVTDPEQPIAIRFRIEHGARPLSFVSTSQSGVFACGLTVTGKAYCWGSNHYGQLGIGIAGFDAEMEGDESYNEVPEPTRVAGDHVFRRIATSTWHSCGINHQGETYCWGDDGWRQLGQPDPCEAEACDGESGSRLTPIPVLAASGQRFTAVALGDFHTCGLTPSGEAYCWGMNRHGQVGNGAEEPIWPEWESPSRVVGGHTFVSLNAAENSTCGVTAADETYCWGRDWGATPVLVPE